MLRVVNLNKLGEISPCIGLYGSKFPLLLWLGVFLYVKLSFSNPNFWGDFISINLHELP
jgi:hypothetical protein